MLGIRDNHQLCRQSPPTCQVTANHCVNSREMHLCHLLSPPLPPGYLLMNDYQRYAGNGTPQLTITGSCGWPEVVAEHIVGCLAHMVSGGTSLLEDSPSDHCPAGRPCRPAGPGIGWELDRRPERSQ